MHVGPTATGGQGVGGYKGVQPGGYTPGGMQKNPSVKPMGFQLKPKCKIFRVLNSYPYKLLCHQERQ